MKKILSPLDKFVFAFCKILEKEVVKYVVVSGYVAIVFGRSRNTEDIDILVKKIDFDKFEKLWRVLSKKYECMNTSNAKDAYFEYLNKKTGIRFYEKGKFIPNFEFKFLKDEKDVYSLENAIRLQINKESIFISPLELQIAYKLALGSLRDIEDARFLFKLFNKHVDKEELKVWIHKLGVSKKTIKKLGV